MVFAFGLRTLKHTICLISSMNKQDFQFYYNVTAHEMDTFKLITKTFDDSYRVKKCRFFFFLILRIKCGRKIIRFSITRWMAFLKLLCLFKAHSLYVEHITKTRTKQNTKSKKLYNFE